MLFEVQDGSFSYPNGRQILRDINFQFESESIMSVLGANGAGKTTLLRCMLGLQKWQHGKTLIDGVDAKDIPNKVFWSNIGYVPQAKMPSFVYTVADMVVLGRSSHMGDFARPAGTTGSLCTKHWKQSVLHILQISCATRYPEANTSSPWWPEPSCPNPKCSYLMSQRAIWTLGIKFGYSMF